MDEKNKQLMEDIEGSGIQGKWWKWGLPSWKHATMTDYGNAIASNYLKDLDSNIEYEGLGILGARYSLVPMAQGWQAGYIYQGDFIMVHPKYAYDRESTMLLMAHEATHHAQHILTQADPDKLNPEAKAKQALFATNEQDHDSTVFGIKTTGRTYVMPTEWENTEFYSLTKAMYTLLPNERDARLSEVKIAELYNITSGRGAEGENAKSDLANSINIFKERYDCHDLSDEEIYKLFDNAVINVTSGRVPSNSIEAAMTYDLAVVLDGQNDIGIKKATDMLQIDARNKVLENAGFDMNMDGKYNQSVDLSTLFHEENDLRLLDDVVVYINDFDWDDIAPTEEKKHEPIPTLQPHSSEIQIPDTRHDPSILER